MASELKDARNKLASQEQLFAQELKLEKVSELKVRNLKEEVSKLQKCLEDTDEQLRASLCSTEQNALDGLRSQLSVTQATAESTAASAKPALLHCSSLLGEQNDKDNSLSERELPVNNVSDQLDHLHEYHEGRGFSRRQLKDYSLRIESDITDAFAKAGFDNINKLMKILSDVPAKNIENTDKDYIFEDDSIAKLREGVGVLSAHWKSKSKELESQLDKHRKTVQELKRKVLKLEFSRTTISIAKTSEDLRMVESHLSALEPIVNTANIQIREKRDSALTLKELRNQVAVEQPSGGCTGDKHNLWESSAFKLIASMTMLRS